MVKRLIPRFTAEQLDCLDVRKDRNGTPMVWERGGLIASRMIGDACEMVFWDKATGQVTVVHRVPDPDEGWNVKAIAELCYVAPVGAVQVLSNAFADVGENIEPAALESILVMFGNWMVSQVDAIASLKGLPKGDVWDAIHALGALTRDTDET